MSSLIEATLEDIKKLTPCNHEIVKEQIIYDVSTWLWNQRLCAICGAALGAV